jgi:hypothetical protein
MEINLTLEQKFKLVKEMIANDDIAFQDKDERISLSEDLKVIISFNTILIKVK